MDVAVAGRAFAVWLGILGLAVANGVLREAVLIPRLGGRAGLLLSGVLLSALIVGAAWLALPWLAVPRPSGLWAVGGGWLLLTLLFELSFGRLQGKPWPLLLEAYTFRGGNLWPLVLLVTLLAPRLAAWLRGLG